MSRGYYPGGYDDMYPPMYPQEMPGQYPMRPMVNIGEPIIWAETEQDGYAYRAPNGTTAIIMIKRAPVFMIKTTDTIGREIGCEVYDYTMRKRPGADQEQSGQMDLTKLATIEQLQAVVGPIESRLAALENAQNGMQQSGEA